MRASIKFVPEERKNGNAPPTEDLSTMADGMQSPRTLRVFIASPSDVADERNALRRLLRDINDVLTFLDPLRNLRLELVGYETDSYPDFGSPQDVINRQIPVDYDIFVGIMWKRCGTPTKNAPSGTIEEYRRACEKRKQGGLPRIMFYFCDEPIALPSEEELIQLGAGSQVSARSQRTRADVQLSQPR